MSLSNRLFLGLLGVLLLGGVLWYAWWFAANFERYSEEVRADISPQARKNRFLAAELFLQRNDQAVQSHAGRDIFNYQPAANDTIFLAGFSRYFLERNHDRLREWINAGGNLILVPESVYDDEEDERFPLLQELGVELRYDWQDYAEEDSADSAGSCAVDNAPAQTEGGEESTKAEAVDDGSDTNDEAVAEADSVEEEPENLESIVVFHTEQPGDHQASFLPARYLRTDEERAEVVVGDDEHTYLARYNVGSGSVTALSDTELFSNNSIGELDHAYLLYKLAYTPGTVWIFYSADMPSLWTLMWQRVPYLTLLTIILLALAGWRMLRRSGPRLGVQSAARRNLLEHLDASAEYSWRIDKARQLFADNRVAVEQAWRRRHPQLNRLDEVARCEWIGEKAGIAPAAVRRTLYAEASAEQDFIRASSVLQSLADKVKRSL